MIFWIIGAVLVFIGFFGGAGHFNPRTEAARIAFTDPARWGRSYLLSRGIIVMGIVLIIIGIVI